MAERDKLLKTGLPGPRSFEVRNLLNTHMPIWNSTTQRWDTILSSALATALDHGTLTGLTDDDHTQYLLASSATSRAAFATNWTDLTDAGATTLHKHSHGNLDNNLVDDHTQYLLASAATSRALFATNWTDLTDTGATTLHKHDHGGMDGLADDDHPQYPLAASTETISGAWTYSTTIALATGVRLDFTDEVLEKILLFGAAGSTSTYSIGIEGSTQYYKSNSLYRWYINTNADAGSSHYMSLSTAGLETRTGVYQSIANTFEWRNNGGNATMTMSNTGILSLIDRTAAAPYVAFYNSSGTRIGFHQTAGANTYIANDVVTSTIRLRALNGSGTPYELAWEGGTQKVYLAAKDAIDASDTYLRLNQSSSFSSGIYTPGSFRSDGYVYIGDATHYFRNITGTYGGLTVAGTNGGYGGLHVDGGSTFMDSASYFGLYSEAHAQWGILCTKGGSVAFQHGAVYYAQTIAYNANGSTSGFQILDQTATMRDVGFNIMTELSGESTHTLARDTVGRCLYTDNGSSYTYTTPASSDTTVPIGAVWNIAVYNGTITVNAGSGSGLYWLNGAGVPGSASRTISSGAMVSIWRQSAANFWIWGSGIS